jgi:hypothetical protein
MLTERELRLELAAASAHVVDDETRAAQAMARGHRLVVRRRRARVVVASVVVAACGLATPAFLHSTPAVPPTTNAAVACEPGRTVVSTPHVASLPSGAVVTITNRTRGSVIVHLGTETAVEGQFPLAAGRQSVQCVTADAVTPAGSISVLPADAA